MGWKNTGRSSEEPTHKRFITNGVVLGVAAAMLIAIFVEFVPAPAFHGLHIAILFLVLGIIGTGCLLSYASRKGTLSNLLDKGPLYFVFLCLAMPVGLGLVSWMAFGKSLPWAYTRMFGYGYSETVVMETHYTRSRRSCNYRLHGTIMERAFPSHLCIGEEFYRRYPEQKISVRLEGKQSALGVSIQRIYSDE